MFIHDSNFSFSCTIHKIMNKQIIPSEEIYVFKISIKNEDMTTHISISKKVNQYEICWDRLTLYCINFRFARDICLDVIYIMCLQFVTIHIDFQIDSKVFKTLVIMNTDGKCRKQKDDLLDFTKDMIDSVKSKLIQSEEKKIDENDVKSIEKLPTELKKLIMKMVPDKKPFELQINIKDEDRVSNIFLSQHKNEFKVRWGKIIYLCEDFETSQDTCLDIIQSLGLNFFDPQIDFYIKSDMSKKIGTMFIGDWTTTNRYSIKIIKKYMNVMKSIIINSYYY